MKKQSLSKGLKLLLLIATIFISGQHALGQKRSSGKKQNKPSTAKPGKSNNGPQVRWIKVARDGFEAEFPGNPTVGKVGIATTYVLQSKNNFVIAVTSGYSGGLDPTVVAQSDLALEDMICKPYQTRIGCELKFDANLSKVAEGYYMSRYQIRLFSATQEEQIGHAYHISKGNRRFILMLQYFNEKGKAIVDRFESSFKF